MRKTGASAAVVVAALAVGGGPRLSQAAVTAGAASRTPASERAAKSVDALAASFDVNAGQWDDAVRFVARGGAVTAAFEDGAALLALGVDGPDPRPDGPRRRPASRSGGVVAMRFGGARPAGEDRSTTKVSYFLGNDPSRWRADVGAFGRVRFAGVAPGVDLVWRGTRRSLEYDVLVAPGADASAFAFDLVGAASLRVDEATGDLVAAAPCGGELRQSRPRAFQSVDGARRDVACRFVVEGTRVRFDVGRHDPSLALVIDPTLGYATYLGGSGGDWTNSVAAGPTGDAYVTGYSTSSNFPTASPYQSSSGGGLDVVVSRMRADGSGLVFSTYIGGSGADYGQSICVDSQGAAVVTGQTGSSNFPVLAAAQPGLGGGSRGDAFVTKIAAAGTSIVWSTYLGGSGNDLGFAVAVDGAGAVYVAGNTFSTDFPVRNARQSVYGGGGDGFVAKYGSNGALAWSTYHGGNAGDVIYGIAADAAGSAYVVGYTISTNLAVANAYKASFSGGFTDAFVAKYAPSGSSLIYGTYLGGSGDDYAMSVAVDASGDAFVCGKTTSTDFPTVSPRQAANAGGYDAFVAKFSPAGNSLTSSTYFGGSAEDSAWSIALDALGGFVVAGETASTNLPTANAFQPTFGGGPGNGNFAFDGWIARFPDASSAPTWSTYLGGSSEDDLQSVAIDGDGHVWVAGSTYSTDFPARSPYQPAHAGGSVDSFLARVDPAAPTAPDSLSATLVGAASVHLAWNDASVGETGFGLDRQIADGPFTSYAVLPPNATSYDDASVFGGVIYGYRVRALGVEAPSPYSNTATIAVPSGGGGAPPPRAPDGLVAVAVSSTEVALSWSDRSNDERFFEVQRADAAGAFATVGAVAQDATSFVDSTVRPGWPATYRVRALAPQGPSSWSDPAEATAPASLVVAMKSGSLVDSTKHLHDSLKASVAFSSDPAAAVLFDPVAAGLALRLGPAGAPLSLSVAPNDATWKKTFVRRGKTKSLSKETWKSPKGAAPRATIVVDVVKQTVTATISAFDFSSAATSGFSLFLAAGAAGGASSTAWTEGRPGVFKFKTK